MTLGLLATAIIAFFTYKTGFYIDVLTTISYPILAVIELVVVVVFSLAFRKLPPLVVTILYYVYAILNGVTMSIIFAAYDIGTISLAFFVTAFLFGGLALYGYTTKRDISKLSTICMDWNNCINNKHIYWKYNCRYNIRLGYAYCILWTNSL